MWLTLLRTAAIYALLLFAMRLLGKRQLGELELSELVVTVLVADIMGMLYERREETHVAGEGYSLDIDCSRLRRGQYILYINVNGEVTSEKFNI